MLLTHSRTNAFLWSNWGLLWPNKKTLKTHATVLSFWLQTDIDWIIKWSFMSQSPSLNGCKVIGHQSWLSKKILDTMGSRLRSSQNHYCKSGLRAIRVRFPVAAHFEGFYFWSPLTYRVKNYFFGKIWSIVIRIKENKHFAALLRHVILSQNTLKSYHNRPKSRFNLQGTVHSATLPRLVPHLQCVWTLQL